MSRQSEAVTPAASRDLSREVVLRDLSRVSSRPDGCFHELLQDLCREYDRAVMRHHDALQEIERLRRKLEEDRAAEGERLALPGVDARTVKGRRSRGHDLGIRPRALPLPPRTPRSPRPPPEEWPKAVVPQGFTNGQAVSFAGYGRDARGREPASPSPSKRPDSPKKRDSKSEQSATKSALKVAVLTVETADEQLSPTSPTSPTSKKSSDDDEPDSPHSPDSNAGSDVSPDSPHSAATNNEDNEGSHRSKDSGDNFEVLAIWTTKAKSRRPSTCSMNSQDDPASPTSFSSQSPTRSKTGASLGSSRARDDDVDEANCCCELFQRMVMKPSSTQLMVWDVWTILILLYDLIVIPLSAYELPEQGFLEYMEFTATLTWTVDIALSFFKGFEVRGVIEMRLRRVLINYLKTWFLFDVSIVAVDWVLTFYKSGDLVDWLRFSRVRRALRLLRLARLAKHGSKFLSINELIQSEEWIAILSIVWMLLILMMVNHFISCGWYAVGSLSVPGVTEKSWPQKFLSDDRWQVYRYLTSFHWSITQFTPASMEITPTNVIERVYNIITIMLGMVMFSSFISSMTNSMTYLRQLNFAKRQEAQALRRYFLSKAVTMDLGNAIMSFVRTNGSGKKKVALSTSSKELMALRALPNDLLTRLHDEVYGPVLSNHPLFATIRQEEPGTSTNLCHTAVSEKICNIGEEIFKQGGRSSAMYFLVKGEGVYVLFFEEQINLQVAGGTWIAEAAMWVKWEHRGRLTGGTVCEFALLDINEFHRLIIRSRTFLQIQRYAKLYAQAAVQECNGAEYVSDLWGQRIRVQDLSRKAFNNDEMAAASTLMALWASDITNEKVFTKWRIAVQEEKLMRKPGLRGAFWRCRFRMKRKVGI